MEVTLAQNVNKAPIAFGFFFCFLFFSFLFCSVLFFPILSQRLVLGQHVSVNGSDTAQITLQGSIDVASSEYRVVVLDFESDLGNLTTSDGTPVRNGVPFSDPVVTYIPPDYTYSSMGYPVGTFSFQIIGDSELRSEPAEIPLFVNYLGVVPALDDRSVDFKAGIDNVFEPVEVPREGPPPIEFTLTFFPPLADCAVYQSSNDQRVGPAISTVPTKINDQLIFSCTMPGNFSYTATDVSANTSSPATISYEVLAPSTFPTIHRCIVNVAEYSATVIDFRNEDCVVPAFGMLSLTSISLHSFPSSHPLLRWGCSE